MYNRWEGKKILINSEVWSHLIKCSIQAHLVVLVASNSFFKKSHNFRIIQFFENSTNIIHEQYLAFQMFLPVV